MLLLQANLGSCAESLSPHSICQEGHKGLPSSRGKEKLIRVWQGVGRAGGTGNISVASFGKYNLPHSGYNKGLYWNRTTME